MTPKEVFLSVKASRARQDRQYQQFAEFVAYIVNASGNLKKDVTPDALYTPLLKPTAVKHTEADILAQKRAMKEELDKLHATAPAPVVRPDPNFTL